jgi:TPP-dependent pyruvate/acetoin dehydrogenase alpha subunit
MADIEGMAEGTGVRDPTDTLAFYEMMVLIRTFENEVYLLFLSGEVPGTIHLYQGQEAVAVGVCAHLRTDDILLTTHRPHGHALAKGMAPKPLMAEIFGKATGCCKGKGGSMHVCDMEVGLPPAIAIVGAGIPIAAGAALAFDLRGEDRVAVSMFGDGATNTGAFHEGLTLAAVWNLPVIFVCENNLYAVSTRVSDASRLTDLAEHGHCYDIPHVTVDGNDVLAVSEVAGEAVARARAGGGPTLIEAKTYRHGGHSRSDAAAYRPAGEKEAWLQKDPIPHLRAWLLAGGRADEAELDAIEAACRARVDEAVAFARASPWPAPSTALSDVWEEAP